MWLSKMGASSISMPERTAEIGVVTIGGNMLSVNTDSEKRNMLVCAPGGFHWTPKAGGQVLIIKTDEGEHAVIGTLDDSRPDEVRLAAGGAEICLKNGKVTISGDLCVQGDLSVSGGAEIGSTLTVAGVRYRG